MIASPFRSSRRRSAVTMDLTRVIFMTIIYSIAILVVNILVLSTQNSLTTGAASFISPDFFGSFRGSRALGGEGDDSPVEYPKNDLQAFDPTPRILAAAVPKEGRLRPSRTLVGILSNDSFNDRFYRRRHRLLFELWNDTRVCSLPEYEATQNPNCQLIFTFVLGGNKDPNAPTELVNASYPILATKPIETKREDINYADTSILNIRCVT
jgi:hypothetical protein